MKLSDFILLNEEEKKHAVLHEGVLLCKRKLHSSIIFLFHVQRFYVEACFNSDSKEVEAFRMFSDTRLLQPYLEGISIDELLN